MYNRFGTIGYLDEGSLQQKQAYQILKQYYLMEKLAAYQPILAGTFPLDIAIEGSDLDIICTFQQQNDFEESLRENFSGQRGFELTLTSIHKQPTVIANFEADGWLVEIFGQPVPVAQQAAYRHMVIEYYLLQQYGHSLKQAVVALKMQGHKTEPAFALALGIAGNPYAELLRLYDELIEPQA